MISGYIPEKILYVCQKSRSITPKFSDTDEEFFSTSAMPAFPVDPAKENTVETARNWAKGYSYGHQNTEVHKEVELVNEPIYEVQIVDLEVRDQGGRAYKAIVHGSFLVDIREDVMLEAMLEKGIRLGSFINCNFIWVKIGSQMKLIRNGSTLHKAVQAAHELKAQKKVSTKDLKVGHFYQNIQSTYLFLGFVKTADVTSKYVSKRNHMLLGRNRHADNGCYVVTGHSKIEKRQVWLDCNREILNNAKSEDYIMSIDDVKTIMKEWGYALTNTKSKTIYPHISINPIELPDDIIDVAAKLHMKYFNINSSKRNDGLVQHMDVAIMQKYPNAPKFNETTQRIWDEAIIAEANSVNE